MPSPRALRRATALQRANQAKSGSVNISLITAGEGGRVYGLGDDDKVYLWVPLSTGSWVLYSEDAA